MNKMCLILALAVGGCATTKTQLREAAWDEHPMAWPVGTYDVVGRVAFGGTSVPSSESRTYHATLMVENGNLISLLNSNSGTCGDAATVRGDRVGFGCGDVSFTLVTDGTAVWGTVTRTVSVEQPTEEWRCIQYRTDEQGMRTCVRWDRSRDRTHRVTATGQLSVTVSG